MTENPEEFKTKTKSSENKYLGSYNDGQENDDIRFYGDHTLSNYIKRTVNSTSTFEEFVSNVMDQRVKIYKIFKYEEYCCDQINVCEKIIYDLTFRLAYVDFEECRCDLREYKLLRIVVAIIYVKDYITRPRYKDRLCRVLFMKFHDYYF